MMFQIQLNNYHSIIQNLFSNGTFSNLFSNGTHFVVLPIVCSFLFRVPSFNSDIFFQSFKKKTFLKLNKWNLLWFYQNPWLRKKNQLTDKWIKRRTKKHQNEWKNWIANYNPMNQWNEKNQFFNQKWIQFIIIINVIIAIIVYYFEYIHLINYRT